MQINQGKKRKQSAKSTRMQRKAFFCVIGFCLIVLLIVCNVISVIENQQGAKEPIPFTSTELEESISKKENYCANVLVLENKEDGIWVYSDGERVYYPYEEQKTDVDFWNENVQIADVTLVNDYITDIKIKNDKINGKILAVNEDSIEVEGYGKLPLDEAYKGYKLYDSMSMCTAKDILIGYDFADLCLDNGKICAVLMTKEETMDYVRVLLKGSDYAGEYHDAIEMYSKVSIHITYLQDGRYCTDVLSAGEKLCVTGDESWFTEGMVHIEPEVLTEGITITNLKREKKNPTYKGIIEIKKTEKGLVLINEVLLEDYLCSVVPSEMPASYPEEALKAQAICARTYAYGHLFHAGYPEYGAHMDDSTSYQVYNNIEEQIRSTNAVKDTYGQTLMAPDGAVAETFYYSTSCGLGTDPTIWKTESASKISYISGGRLNDMDKSVQADKYQQEEEFYNYITTVDKNDFEADEIWYRWSINVSEFSTENLLERLKERYKAKPELILTWTKDGFIAKDIDKLGNVKDIYIDKRGAGGVVDELIIDGTAGKYKIISEYNIRFVLNDSETKVERQDGSMVNSKSLIPSGFFVISTRKEGENVIGYSLIGGGFGHGVGMSQNGAKDMAKAGYTTEDILNYFYSDCEIENIYEESRGE